MKPSRDLSNWMEYNLEAKAKRILAGFAFRESDFNRPA